MPSGTTTSDRLGTPTLIETGPIAEGSTLRLLRERRGLRAHEIATQLGRSPAFISKAENGQTTVTGSMLERYAQQLSVPPQLLSKPIPVEPAEGVHFRSNKVSQRVRSQAIAEANYVAWLLNTLHEHAHATRGPDRLQMPSFDADLLDGGAAEAALLVRRQWRLEGPVLDPARLLERAGVFILPMPETIIDIDAITVRTRGPVTAVILLSEKAPVDRQRHTLAHELGHLVLDTETRSMSLKADEERADGFAGEFLAPYHEVGADLRGITPAQIDTLQALRDRWGVSLAALIRRAFLHRDLNESQYRYWFRVLNARRAAPTNHGFHFTMRPTATRDFLELLSENGYSVAQLTDLIGNDLRDLQDSFGPHWPHRPLKPNLHVVGR